MDSEYEVSMSDRVNGDIKGLSPNVRHLFPGLVRSLRSQYGSGIYSGFPGTALVGADRCQDVETASVMLVELETIGFLVRVDETQIKFTEKSQVFIEHPHIEVTDLSPRQDHSNGGDKQHLKKLRRDVRKVVVEFGRLELKQGDAELAVAFVRVQAQLEQIESLDGFFLACEELAQGNHLVARSKEGYYINPDDQLRLQLADKALGVVRPTQEPVSAPPLPTKEVKKTEDPLPVPQPPKTASQCEGQQWRQFIVQHPDFDRWSQPLRLYLVSKGKGFHTLAMLDVLTEFFGIGRTGVSGLVYRVEKLGMLRSQRSGADKRDGKAVDWVQDNAQVSGSFRVHLARLEQEASAK